MVISGRSWVMLAHRQASDNLCANLGSLIAAGCMGAVQTYGLHQLPCKAPLSHEPKSFVLALVIIVPTTRFAVGQSEHQNCHCYHACANQVTITSSCHVAVLCRQPLDSNQKGP